jgi:hypothetical protein
VRVGPGLGAIIFNKEARLPDNLTQKKKNIEQPRWAVLIPSSVSNATNLSFNLLIILVFLTENRKRY